MIAGTILKSRVLFFALGTVAAGAIGSAPGVRQGVRRLMREAVKGGLTVGRCVQDFADQLREDWQDLVTEAQAEIAKAEAEKESETPK